MPKEFNIEDLYDRFMYYEKYGIITPYYDEGIGDVFTKELVKDNYLKEEISEKIRLLYVALTRAREKLIIVTNLNDNIVFSLEKSNSFFDMLNYIKDILNPYINDFDINDINLTKDYQVITKNNFKESISKSNEKIEIKELDIPNSEIVKEQISKENNKLIDKDTKEKLKFGTEIHEILELIDFNDVDIDTLDVNDFYKEKIKYFIDNIDIDNVKNIYKEYEFTYEEDNELYHGIIDLILEYDDKIKIIDYKLNNIDDKAYIKQLNNYKKYISSKTNKKIELYLFSIVSLTFKEIKENM